MSSMSSFKTKRGLSPSTDDRSCALAEYTPDNQLGCEYEVFLNFCGHDTRGSFTDHLYQNLKKAGIRTFKDDEDHPKGEKTEKILQAIKQSRISIPIFSKNYASREWCLRELVEMIKCRKTRNQIILPVFLDVKPHVVREQSEGYGEALSKCLTNFKDVNIDDCREALREVSQLTGWVLQDFKGKEGDLVNEITSKVWSNLLAKAKLKLPDPLIPMDGEKKKLMDLMSLNSDGVRFVGIHGKPQSGKTTLAKVIFNEIHDQYERCSFLSDIKEKSEKRGLECLQKQLATEILEGRGPENIYHVDRGINLISERLRQKKVLILLDDVDQKKQLEALAEKPHWFGSGSRILVTTRNKDILEAHQFHGLFLCEVMNHPNSRPQMLLGEIRDPNFNVNTNKVLDLLKNGVSRIGIYGVGGVGKTTLATNVYNYLLKCQNTFKEVFWITVSQDQSIYILQSKIAKQIGIDLLRDDEEKIRAAKLFQTFKEKEIFALFFDDVWRPFSLEDVGISEDLKGCKLILTTRSLDVCQQMRCHADSTIQVGTLSQDDAWKLFKETIGQEVMLTGKIESPAIGITRKCGGLPLAIVTIAGSLGGITDPHEWNDTWRKLKQSKPGHDGMDDKVIPALQLSYDRIKNSLMRQCFCYSAIFSEDELVERDTLIKLFIDVGLIDEGSWQDDFGTGHTVLNKLERASLLIGFERLQLVKMHDLIRDMALRITRSKFMVKSGQLLKEQPEEKEWSSDLEVVSVINCGLEDITISPRCPKMSALLLGSNNLRKIPDYFFEYMSELKVLDLSYNSDIVELPNSVANLVKLTALILCSCSNLERMPSLANLSALRRLNLADTALKELPNGMENLVDLRELNINIHSLRKIAIGILAKFSSLRSLTLPKDSLAAPLNLELANLNKL